MRKIISVGLVALVLAGCGKKAGPTFRGLKGGMPLPVNPVNPVEGTAPTLAPEGPSFEGRPVTQWAEQLEGPNVAIRSEAGLALAKMGEPGYVPLLKGMQSRDVDVQLTALQSITKPVLVAHQQETMGLLRSMLGAANAQVRQAAAARLPWYGKDAEVVMTTLQAMAKNDPDENVRRVAGVSVTAIEDHLYRGGKMDRGVKEFPK